MDEQQTAISIKMPQSLRDRIKAAAEAEDRTESSFIRFRIAAVLDEMEAVTQEKGEA